MEQPREEAKEIDDGTNVIYYLQEIEKWKKISQDFSDERLDLQVRIKELEEHKRQYYEVWNPVDEYVRNLPSIKLGESVSSHALKLLKELESNEGQDVLWADVEPIIWQWHKSTGTKWSEIVNKLQSKFHLTRIKPKQ